MSNQDTITRKHGISVWIIAVISLLLSHSALATPITIEGINLEMPSADRISTLQGLHYDCALKQSPPYKGYWTCRNGSKKILMGQSEIYFNCQVFKNCLSRIAEIATSLRQEYPLDAMTSTVFYRQIGRFNWYCGNEASYGDRLCVQKLVKTDHQMIDMMRGAGETAGLDALTQFLLAFRRPHVHLKRNS